jgi:hypothetical protein
VKNYIGLACHAIVSRFAVGWASLIRNIVNDDCKPDEEVRADDRIHFFIAAARFVVISVTNRRLREQSDLDASLISVHTHVRKMEPAFAPGSLHARPRRMWEYFPFLPILVFCSLEHDTAPRVTPVR